MTISVKDWAGKNEVSLITAYKRIKSLGIAMVPRVGIDEDEANSKLAAHCNQRKGKPATKAAIDAAHEAVRPIEELNEARTRRESAKADQARVEADLALGSVILIADVMKVWGNLISPAKTKLMGMGAKLAPMMAVESDAAACKVLIDAAVREALAEMAEYGSR